MLSNPMIAPLLSQLDSITGFLLPEEGQLLFELASRTPRNGVIVEIGSYQGKSTVALGLGAQIAFSAVYAIDDHSGYIERSGTVFGMDNHAALLRNLNAFDLGATVRVVALSSERAVAGWQQPIDLLFIDGRHDYASVRADFDAWSPFVRGKLLMHDTRGDEWPGVGRAVREIIREGRWIASDMVGTISIFERATP